MRSIRLLLIPLLRCATGCGAAPAVAGAPAASGAVAPYPGAAGPFALGGDSITVLPRGTTAFPAIRDLLDRARSSVELEMYELQRGDLVGALVAARARGVRVTVVTDPSVAVSVVSEGRLRGGGVGGLDYPVRRQMIGHAQLLVGHCGAVGFLGGRNWVY